MALVVFLRGVNVGGHRVFRPSTLAAQLKHLGAVNIGAAGTFVIPQPITRTRLRAELVRRLPFDTEIVICDGREIAALLSHSVFADRPAARGVVRFASVLARLPRKTPRLPAQLPPSGRWLLRIVAREGRFVIGEYRRHPQVIRYLGTIDRLFDVPVTTRNWNTMNAIAARLS